MGWEKLGHVFKPDGAIEWMNSHAQVPTVIVRDQFLRVFFSTRNPAGKSLCAYLDLDLRDPLKVLHVGSSPVLGFGKPGTFDDEGVMPSEIIERDGKLWLYYSGWNQRLTVPYHNAMGVAVSEDGGMSFQRIFDGPIMDRTTQEPYLAVTPTVIKDEGLWKAWYISGLRWVQIAGKFEPVYAIKYAHSADGLEWVRIPGLCVAQKHALEAFSRPCVRKENGIFKMWYCFRHSVDYRDGQGSYRLGYADSADGLHWQRKDEEAGISPAQIEDDWDSKMICYPYVVRVKENKYMFYNGNGFGKSGFGVAIWRDA